MSHYNQTAVDNTVVSPADYDKFCVTRPSGLPEAGSSLCGFGDVSFAGRARVPRSVTKLDTNFGDQTEVYNGVDFEMRARLLRGATIQGGISLGQTVNNACFAVDSPQGIAATQSFDYCKVITPWWAGNGQVKLNFTYPLPGGVELSAVYQNLAGAPILANVTFTNALVAPSLGRNLSSCASPTGACTATATLNVIEPNTMFEDRVNQIDLRFAKLLRGSFGRVRLTADLYNLFNAATVVGRNNAWGTAGVGWGRPTAVMGGRLFKAGVQYSWN